MKIIDVGYHVYVYWKQLYRMRGTIEAVSKQNKTDLVGVEIGTALGANAFSILRHLPIKKLYLVDPYMEYSDVIDWEKEKMEKWYEKAQKRLRKFSLKIEFIRTTSDKALEKIPDNIDFVYIDGNHSSPYIDNDIKQYYKKVKVGGILGGHDFSVNFPDVCRAVLNFSDKNKLPFSGKDVDWWFVKK